VTEATDKASTPNTKRMMDSFFDEVFGDDESNNPVSVKTVTSSKNFESQLRKEISSAFCDVNKIRNLILGAGYLPKTVRGQVRNNSTPILNIHCSCLHIYICMYV
jgi:hypothetical protein